MWTCYVCRQFGSHLSLSEVAYPYVFHRFELNNHSLITLLVSMMNLLTVMCVLQFANFGSLEQHGFARNRLWSLDDDPSPLSPANNQSSVDLILKSTEEDLKTWPFRYFVVCTLVEI